MMAGHVGVSFISLFSRRGFTIFDELLIGVPVFSTGFRVLFITLGQKIDDYSVFETIRDFLGANCSLIGSVIR